MAGFITITIINLGVQLLNKSGRRAKLPHRHYLDHSPIEEEEDYDQGALSNSLWEGDLQGPLRRGGRMMMRAFQMQVERRGLLSLQNDKVSLLEVWPGGPSAFLLFFVLHSLIRLSKRLSGDDGRRI